MDRVEDLASALSARAAPAPAPGRRAAVIGAGWAGCTAALELARQGFAVTVFEAARVPGGRARRVVVDGMALDNGQHLLVGAYHECLRLIDSCRGAAPDAAAAYARLPLTLAPWGRFAGAVRLAAWRVPAPLHLAAALATARGLPLGSRAALAASLLRARRGGGSIPERASVAEWFRGLPRDAFAGVVAPLCVAALNTLPEEASARVFANVLARTLAGSRADSDFVIPATDLTALLPEPALREVVARGGTLRLGVSARVVATAAGRVAVAAGAEAFAFDGAVIAVAPHQLDGTLGPDVAALASLPRAAVDRRRLRLRTDLDGLPGLRPAGAPRRADAAPRRPAGAVAVRAPPRSGERDPGERRGACWRSSSARTAATSDSPRTSWHAPSKRSCGGSHPAFQPSTWSRVITERRATYACVPALPRPASAALAPGLHVAGDYTDPELPATLEAAVRSGCAAARSLAGQCRERD